MWASKSPSRRRPIRPRKSDNNRSLVRAILLLPPDPRDVFLPHRMAGMTYEEIGSHLEMAPEAVQMNLAEAIAVLAIAGAVPAARCVIVSE